MYKTHWNSRPDNLLAGCVPPFSNSDYWGEIYLFTRRNQYSLMFAKRPLLAPVVQRVDNAIQRINHYPVDSVVCFANTYPLDSDLSGG